MVDKIQFNTEDPQENSTEATESTGTEEAPKLTSDNAQGQNSEKNQRPEWLPEKFATPEEMSKAYSELEKQFSQTRQQQQDDVEANVEHVAQQAGLDIDALSDEFSQQGGLSDESYQRLTRIGIPQNYVDAYIQGQNALGKQQRQEIFEVTGGEQNFHRMLQWAGKNLSEEEIHAFNQSMSEETYHQAKMATQGLFARFAQVGGVEPNLLSGSAASTNASAFRSVAELTEAMSDPKYQTDPAYRQEVALRLSRSSII